MATSLSVGQVAALLNVSIIIVQFTYPLLLSLIAVGIVNKRTNAATWSVFGRLINSSLWPFLLGTDSSSDRKVLKRIRSMTWLSNGAAILLAIAAAITPLGLHATTKLGPSQDVPFTYVRDTSPIGRATYPRDHYEFDRLCGMRTIINCPGDFNGLNYTFSPNGSIDRTHVTPHPYVSSKVASNITNVFDSIRDAKGLDDTIAGIFDLEYRTFVNAGEKKEPPLNDSSVWVDQGRLRTQGRFQYYQQFLLNSKIEAIEGLIVSTSDSPGIGFRNHTLPPPSQHKYIWTEEILWLEPETVCTDLNVTYDYPLHEDYSEVNRKAGGANLTDRGGLANNPGLSTDVNLKPTQANVRLRERSWAGAVYTNYLLKEFLNVTRQGSQVGKSYPIADIKECDSWKPAPSKLQTTGYGLFYPSSGSWSPSLAGELEICTTSYPDDFDKAVYVDNMVRGYLWDDFQTPSLIASVSGLMQGTAFPVDKNGNSLPLSERSSSAATGEWRQLFLSCSSTVKASIKTVTFESDGLPDLSNLRVRDVQTSNTTQPFWAGEWTGWHIEDIDPLWGPILESQTSHGYVGTLDFHQPEFYLPAGGQSMGSFGLFKPDAIAGAKLPISVLQNVYIPGWVLGDSTIGISPDYSGENSFAMLEEWTRLSSNASTAGRIIDLMWTDMMANAIVGTKSTLPNANAESVLRSAVQYRPTVAYDWRYAMLAICFAALYLVILLASVALYLLKRANISGLRFMLNQTAAGRSMTTERFQGKDAIDFARNKDWAGVRGDEMLIVSKEDATGEASDNLEQVNVQPKRDDDCMIPASS